MVMPSDVLMSAMTLKEEPQKQEEDYKKAQAKDLGWSRDDPRRN